MRPWPSFLILVVFYAVGVFGHLWAPTAGWMEVLTPWFLAAAGGVALASSASPLGRPGLWAWLGSTLVVTFALEAVGVATGLVFGAYHYTAVLGTNLFGVPPVIGFNWVLVVLGVRSLVDRGGPTLPEAVKVVVVAALCVLFDAVLEPVAISHHYWVWAQGTPPWQNYLAWGLIAAGAAWTAGRIPGPKIHPALGAYAGLQATFFVALGLAGSLKWG